MFMLYRDEDEEDFFPDVKEYADDRDDDFDDQNDDEENATDNEPDDDPMPKGCLFVPTALVLFVIGLIYVTL